LTRDKQIVLSWPAVTVPAPAAKYRIQRGTSPDGPFTQLAEITETTYSDSGLANGTDYCYVVAGITAAGTVGPASETKCGAPFALVADHFIAYSTPAGTVGNQSIPGTSVGMDFDIENPIVVKRLGVFDERSDGLKLPLTARIWNRDTEQIVAEVSFSPEEPGELIEGMRFKPLPQTLRLEAGFHGMIEAEGYGEEERIVNSFNNPNNITWTLNSGNGSVVVGSGRYGGPVFRSVDNGPRCTRGTFEFSAPAEFSTPTSVSCAVEDAAVTLRWPAWPSLRPKIHRASAATVYKNGRTSVSNYRDTACRTADTYKACAVRRRSDKDSAVVSARNPQHRAPPTRSRRIGGNQNSSGSVGMDFTAHRSNTKLGALTIPVMD
jgi:hypothetical protein